jgi:hypothetical protein
MPRLTRWTDLTTKIQGCHTQRYAHLIDAPLRAGLNAVGEMLKPRLRLVGEGETIDARPNVT